MLSTLALHSQPADPLDVVAPRHEGTGDDLPLHRPPSFNEADVSDKPPWIALPLLTEERIAEIDQFRKD